MSTTVRTVYVAKCSICGWEHQLGIESLVQGEAAEHDRSHDRMRIVGRELTGLVFDVDDPSMPTFGHFDRANAAAEAAGFRFIAWNGFVYPTSDFGRRICMAKDVPGLTEFQRSAV